ncbi:hypothetical protein PR048_009433 [Dryococelus australis]|uniref:Uncharacterized protein n=1 Tax=Dryococelus australis TaxID=614101 RepID=A0ABQ9I1P9_9NEOP|nr:hypothetical protein PR048_009433 [Dryococelus australis]
MLKMAKQDHAGKFSFQEQWLNEPYFKGWLHQVQGNKYFASCSLCNKIFCLSSMGRTAFTSHMRGAKHLVQCKSSQYSLNIGVFLSPTDSSSHAVRFLTLSSSILTPVTSTTPPCNSISAPTTSAATSVVCNLHHPNETIVKPASLHRFLLNVTRGDELWALQSVITHISMQSAAADVTPYFSQELLKLCRTSCVVVGFDESLNKQMDINIVLKMSMRYLTSTFLDRSRAMDFLNAFQQAVTPSDTKKILQISMNGAIVNLKFLREEDENVAVPLDIDTCGLYTIHCAFKAGINGTGWNVGQFLRALYNVFKNVPFRRAQFKSITVVKHFLLNSMLCAAWRMQMLLKELVIFCLIETSSANHLGFKIQIKDPLLGPKLAFFRTIASQEFQSDWSLVSFLHSALSSVDQTIMERFVKPTTLIMSVDVEEEDKLLPVKKIDLGLDKCCYQKVQWGYRASVFEVS